MPSSRVLLVVVSLCVGAVVLAAAPATSERPRTVAGVCGATNWACVAECIDAECVDRCLREDCEKALDRLKLCTEKAGCTPDDTQCAKRTCGNTCQRSFEPAPPSPEQEKTEPCQGLPAPAAKPPEKLVGTWSLSAASLPMEVDGGPERIEAQPRADYERTLQVTPEGCFILRTSLDEPTLGRGNSLVVRAWGAVEVSGKDRLTLRTKDGQAVGPVCGDKRVIPLTRKKLKFKGGTYRWDIEKEVLTLMVDDASKQTFQFDRKSPEPEKK